MEQATRIDAVNLMVQGALALSEVESNGICVDVPYMEQQINDKETGLDARIRRIHDKLKDMEEVRLWQKTFGRDFNLDSNDQLAEVLFKHLGHKPLRFTDSGKPSVDEEALEMLDIGMVQGLMKMRKLQRTRNTYLTGILRETVDGFIHPIFKLHTVRTYRGSCSNPNFQNQPIRDPLMGAIIRKGFRCRPGHRLLEFDFKGLEVCIGTCYHKDGNMIEYICDESKDMHRDMASECYCLPLSEVSKTIRYCGKNMFVFPQFYGDYYVRCAESLWAAVEKMKLTTVSGKPLRTHMNEQGWKTLASFTKHIQKVEKDFWGTRFRDYDEWKSEHFDQYLRRGFFDLLTGFRCSGVMSFNDVSNYPVQGAAFHCLLWTLIQTQKWLSLSKGPWEESRSCIIGQIHDSMIIDAHHEEVPEIITYVNHVVEKELPAAWPWIIIPLKVEVKQSEVDGNWWEMKEVKQ